MRDFSHLRPCTREMLLGSQPSGSQPIRLSLADTPERERPAVYREFFGHSVFRIDAEPLRDVPFEVDVTLQKLPGLQLFAGRLHGSRNQRTRALAADGVDDFTLMVNLGGPYLVTQGRQEILLGDGEATFMTCAEPGSYTHHPPGDVLALRFPRAPFAPLVSRVEDCYLRRIPRDTQALKLLKEYVDVAWDEQSLASRELQHLVVAHIYDLMAVCLGTARDTAEVARRRGVRAARLHAIKQDIDGNLDRADLSLAGLAARHACTPRFVQRLFEAEGTSFTDYVLARRLARAHRLLTDPRRTSEKISAIAFDAGFADVSYFNRAFRRHYGDTPSGIRGCARRADHQP